LPYLTRYRKRIRHRAPSVTQNLFFASPLPAIWHYQIAGLAYEHEIRSPGAAAPSDGGSATAWHQSWKLSLCFVAFQFAATWLGMYLGLIIGNEQTAAQLSILVFPFAMISNIFVPAVGMPSWLQVLADWNPLSAICGRNPAPYATADSHAEPVAR
jgi:hypothetical protein